MYIGGGDSSYTYETAQTVAILLESAVQAGDMGISFTADDARIAPPAYGENTRTLLYIALAIVLLAALVLPFVFFRGFAAPASIPPSRISSSRPCALRLSRRGCWNLRWERPHLPVRLLVTLFFNGSVYRAIKAEFMTGKTVDSSVKGGYKKSLAGDAGYLCRPHSGGARPPDRRGGSARAGDPGAHLSGDGGVLQSALDPFHQLYAALRVQGQI